MTFFSRHTSFQYFHGRTLSLLFLLTLFISLYACGFQLRGSISLSEDISPLYLEQNTVFELAREIRTLLASNKIKVVDAAVSSNAQLILLNEEKSRRVLSVDGSGRAKEYLLQYKVHFVISTKPMKTRATKNMVDEKPNNQDTISVTRSLVFDPDAVLAVTNEADILYKDMQRDVARLILLKLQARSNKQSRTATPAAAIEKP